MSAELNQVQDAVEKFTLNQMMRNRALTLRSEAVAGLPFLRESPFPAHQGQQNPFIKVMAMTEAQRKTYGKQIFSRVFDYLRMLGANGFYVKGSLKSQIQIYINKNKLTSVQLCPEFLGRKLEPIKYIEELKDFLFADVKLPPSKNINDFLFPATIHNVGEENTLENSASIVSNIGEIRLTETPGKVFICDGQVLNTQAIFEAKKKLYATDGSRELWIVLARFVNEHRAVNNIRLLPEWLNQHLVYKNPKPLSDDFINLCIRDNPLESLRIVLGISPKPVEFEDPSIPKAIKEEMAKLPIWYQQRLYQLSYIAHEFTEDQVVKTDGIKISCPAKKEFIIQLIDQYE